MRSTATVPRSLGAPRGSHRVTINTPSTGATFRGNLSLHDGGHGDVLAVTRAAMDTSATGIRKMRADF